MIRPDRNSPAATRLLTAALLTGTLMTGTLMTGTLMTGTLLAAPAVLAAEDKATVKTVSSVIAASGPGDWRGLVAEDTLVMRLAGDRVVVIELAPAFAPAHAANIRTLVREGYFNGLAVVRVQDNYVAQWGDPAEDGSPEVRPLGSAKSALAPEFHAKAAAVPAFTPIPGPDAYAPEVGFVNSFPAARNPLTGQVWLTHCYASVGVARGAPDSGSGAGLYAVIGHAPRHLDRNITLVGRVVQGIEHLSALPRGTGRLGFYEQAGQRTPILSVQVAADLTEAERPRLQVMRTDTAVWAEYVEARRNRRDDWFFEPQNGSDVCNTLPIIRPVPAG
ncbi:MAG: hypothetical protein RLY86_2439 [Pseudomonadota bacterium]|jgi:peptidylprolyl isomerase